MFNKLQEIFDEHVMKEHPTVLTSNDHSDLQKYEVTAQDNDFKPTESSWNIMN